MSSPEAPKRLIFIDDKEIDVVEQRQNVIHNLATHEQELRAVLYHVVHLLRHRDNLLNLTKELDPVNADLHRIEDWLVHYTAYCADFFTLPKTMQLLSAVHNLSNCLVN